MTPSTAKSSSGFPVLGRSRDGNEHQAGRTYVEVEEPVADLERFEKWLTAIGDLIVRNRRWCRGTLGGAALP